MQTLSLPGYRLLAPFHETGANVLHHAVRDTDGRLVIVKTPQSQYPGSRDRARYQQEHALLRRLGGTPGVLTAHALEIAHDRPFLVLEELNGVSLAWKGRGLSSTALAFARESREAWWQWGAEGKARLVGEQWPALVAPARSGHTSTGSYDTDSSHLDALTVVKAQQAISSEIVLEPLVDTLLRVALENAGAQRGALLLPRGDTLEVSALVDTRSAEGSSAEKPAGQLPWTLLSYVRRSGEHVLIPDTARPHSFSSDPYFAHSVARCVLCLPLSRQEEFAGLLYLENGLVTEAFSPNRIALLRHIASQAAISIENARLYAEVRRAEAALRRSNDELERRVEERTRELKQAQAHLVETARSVGMADIASNILHEVGNTLIGIVVDSNEMRRTVETSRVGRVKRVAKLLEDHRMELTHFVNHDPHGRHLPGYVSSLAEELAEEQTALKRSLEGLDTHVGRVRAIVQSQRTYARSTLLLDDHDPVELVEEALRLQSAPLRQAGVSVTKELTVLPKVRVDRQRVLQILLHLFSNACAALEPVPKGERRLRVRLSSEDGWIRLQVEDNGEGLRPEHRGHLFMQGFSTRKNGYGIGLHSSALAARLMGGQLTLESEGPGKGATATLELPVTEAASRRSE